MDKQILRLIKVMFTWMILERKARRIDYKVKGLKISLNSVHDHESVGRIQDQLNDKIKERDIIESNIFDLEQIINTDESTNNTINTGD